MLVMAQEYHQVMDEDQAVLKCTTILARCPSTWSKAWPSPCSVCVFIMRWMDIDAYMVAHDEQHSPQEIDGLTDIKLSDHILI